MEVEVEEEAKASTIDGWTVCLGDLTVKKLLIFWTNFNFWQSGFLRCRRAFTLKFGLDTSMGWRHRVHSTLLLL